MAPYGLSDGLRAHLLTYLQGATPHQKPSQQDEMRKGRERFGH